MTAEQPTCRSVQDALVDREPSDDLQQHIASCATCQGVLEMTRSIRTELEPVPAAPGQRPQWIAELHARAARRRKRLAWTAGGLAVAAAAVAIATLDFSGLIGRANDPPAKPSGVILPQPTPPAPVTVTVTPARDASPFERPAWITSDTPFTGYCTDAGQVSCFGVSSSKSSKEAGLDEARDAAFDALSGLIADRIHGEVFDRQVRPAYEATRREWIRAYGVRAKDDDVPASDPIYQRLVDARHRAAQALVADASAFLPVAPADWYWEEFANEKAGGSSFVVYMRFDLNNVQLGRLTELYGTDQQRQSQRVLTAFPLLAFAFADFRGGLIDLGQLGSSSSARDLRQAIRTTAR